MSVSEHDVARVLSEALPYMQRYDEEVVVVKYGGHAMGDEHLAREFARDVVLLEQTAINPIVVHGGGPQIEAMLKRAGVESQFAGGLRITDAKTLEIVEMVLAGSINKQIVGFINAAGGKAIGLCGKDGNMVIAKKATRRVVDSNSNIEKVVDLGFVGEPDKVDTGVLDKNKELIKEMSVADVRALIADGTISGGMIPKVETCIYALEKGVEGVVILDGKVPHAVLLELLTDLGAGTLIHR